MSDQNPMTDEERVLAALRESHPPEKATVAVFWVNPMRMLDSARRRLDSARQECGALDIGDDSRDWGSEYEERLVDLLIAFHILSLRNVSQDGAIVDEPTEATRLERNQ